MGPQASESAVVRSFLSSSSSASQPGSGFSDFLACPPFQTPGAGISSTRVIAESLARTPAEKSSFPVKIPIARHKKPIARRRSSTASTCESTTSDAFLAGCDTGPLFLPPPPPPLQSSPTRSNHIARPRQNSVEKFFERPAIPMEDLIAAPQSQQQQPSAAPPHVDAATRATLSRQSLDNRSNTARQIDAGDGVAAFLLPLRPGCAPSEDAKRRSSDHRRGSSRSRNSTNSTRSNRASNKNEYLSADTAGGFLSPQILRRTEGSPVATTVSTFESRVSDSVGVVPLGNPRRHTVCSDSLEFERMSSEGKSNTTHVINEGTIFRDTYESTSPQSPSDSPRLPVFGALPTFSSSGSLNSPTLPPPGPSSARPSSERRKKELKNHLRAGGGPDTAGPVETVPGEAEKERYEHRSSAPSTTSNPFHLKITRTSQSGTVDDAPLTFTIECSSHRPSCFGSKIANDGDAPPHSQAVERSVERAFERGVQNSETGGVIYDVRRPSDNTPPAGERRNLTAADTPIKKLSKRRLNDPDDLFTRERGAYPNSTRSSSKATSMRLPGPGQSLTRASLQQLPAEPPAEPLRRQTMRDLSATRTDTSSFSSAVLQGPRNSSPESSRGVVRDLSIPSEPRAYPTRSRRFWTPRRRRWSLTPSTTPESNSPPSSPPLTLPPRPASSIYSSSDLRKKSSSGIGATLVGSAPLTWLKEKVLRTPSRRMGAAMGVCCGPRDDGSAKKIAAAKNGWDFLHAEPGEGEEGLNGLNNANYANLSDIEKFDKAYAGDDIRAFVELVRSKQPIGELPEKMHPWAEDPKSIGALAATQIAILASREGEKDMKVRIREAGAIPLLIKELECVENDRVHAAVVALSFLSVDDSKNCHEIFEHNGLAKLVHFLADPLDGLRGASAQICRNVFVLGAKQRAEFKRLGGIPLLVALLDLPPDGYDPDSLFSQLEAIYHVEDLILESGEELPEYVADVKAAGAVRRLAALTKVANKDVSEAADYLHLRLAD